MKRECVILIPAYNPSAKVVNYVKELIENGFHSIIFIDDGCKKECKPIFENLSKLKEVTILPHSKNLGKGRGLKNGFNAFLNRYAGDPRIKGVITVDSDGQHSVKDVLHMAEELSSQKEPALILGSRSFKGKAVPFKSKFGNIITAFVFRILYGRKLTDTQTGLRGIPTELVYEFLDLAGERFEYETNMLIHCATNRIPMEELVIDTIYIDQNSETHFNPFKDSIKIYYVLFKGFFKYIVSSLSASIIDLLIFRIILTLFRSGGGANRNSQSFCLQ